MHVRKKNNFDAIFSFIRLIIMTNNDSRILSQHVSLSVLSQCVFKAKIQF